MQPQIERPNFERYPLSGLRGLSPDFFEPETYHFEGTDVLRATAGRIHGSIQRYSGTSPGIELASSSEFAELGNKDLPIYARRHDIIHTVIENQFTIIVAETGAGKSTQVPQFLLDYFDNIYLTQPRRAAARNIFERIRDEISSVRGEFEAGNLVNYQTAGERDGPQDAHIKVVTDGLQLVRELRRKNAGEHDVLIIDEVHEENANIETLIAWTKKQAAENPNLHVVLMSATVDANRRALYLSEACAKIPPIIEVSGRNFHIERSEEPNSYAAKQATIVAKKLYDAKLAPDDPNGVLVFTAGKRQIRGAMDEIRRTLPSEISAITTILPLHSKLSPAEQQAAIRHYPGLKIVVSTNLAQTSLTIPDIKYVIDSGMHKQREIDDEGTQGLILRPISQADCDQRAGRAGRVSDGYYILTGMDSKTPFTSYIARDKYPTPEILRTDIVRLALRVATVDLDISELGYYDPVNSNVTDRAMATLRTLGALQEPDENNTIITAIGKRMDLFPIGAASARMMVEADRYSENTRAFLAAIVAAKEVGGLQDFGPGISKRWKSLTDEETSSDHLAWLNIFIATQNMSANEIQSYGLDVQAVERAHEQYRKIAKLAGALQETLPPTTPEERENLRRCISAGLVASVYRRAGRGFYRQLGPSETLRKLSSRSVVDRASIVVADPYRVEKYKSGKPTIEHVLEHVTTVTLANIGQAALHLTQQELDGLTMRGGTFVERKRLTLFGVDLGITEETVAEPSPALRQTIIDHAFAHAGPQQQKLRKIKGELEALFHKAKDPIPQLTQARLKELIHAAAPDDIIDPVEIENNLRELLNSGFSLNSFVSVDQQIDIELNAPDEIMLDGIMLHLTYRNSRPLIRHYDIDDIAKLQGDILLEDGRQVYFIHNGKRYTLPKLQQKLANS